MKFTEREQRLLALVPVDGTRVSTHDIVKQIYGEEPPINARQIVLGRMTGIICKTTHMSLGWRLFKSSRRGPKPAEFWIESDDRALGGSNET